MRLPLINPSKPGLSLFIGKNDPSAGSPTDTLLCLFLPLSDMSYTNFWLGQSWEFDEPLESVEAAGGEYKAQGRNQHGLMTHAY